MFLGGTPLKFNSEFTPGPKKSSKHHFSVARCLIFRGVKIKWLKNSFGNMSQIDNSFPLSFGVNENL